MSDPEYYERQLEVEEVSDGPSPIITALRTLRGYIVPIVLAVAAVGVAYTLGAVIYMLTRPVQRNVNLKFRLEFPGADAGEYPNGLKFSGSDIIDTPVLRSVFDANQLGRFMTFSEFSNSVVVLETNAALDQLAREYEAKFANPKLSPVERDRLETEYNQKRASLRKNEYSLVLTTREGLTRVPATVTSKVLYDILRSWSDFAATTRQVLIHRVPLVSDKAIAQQAQVDSDILTALLALRMSARELRNNITELAKLPGSEVVRSTGRGYSLNELDLELSQIERSGLEYAIASAIRSGVTDRQRATTMLEAQLAYDTRVLTAAEDRVRALRDSFNDYLQRQREAQVEAPKNGEPNQQPVGENVVPQVNETFLSSIVALAQNASDLDYRQRAVTDIKQASLATVPLRATVEYEKQLLDGLRSGGGGGADSVQTLRALHGRYITQLQNVARDLGSIREVLSRSLTVSGQLYTVTQPPVAVTERSVSLRHLALGGVVALLLTAIIAVAAALLHARFRAGTTY